MSFSDLLDRFASAVQAGDGGALADLFTDDGVYDDYFFGPSAPGREGIAAMLDHFYEGGEEFRWEFFDGTANDDRGYASYRFSFNSKLHGRARVIFEGISRFVLVNGRIARYSEVFDRSVPLAQQGFDADRIKRIAEKNAARLTERPEFDSHVHFADPGD
jgi:hypothetical protein